MHSNDSIRPRNKREKYALFLRRIFGKKKKTLPSRILGSIVILGLERFGDSILTTPLLRTLRTAYPNLKIYVVTPGRRAYSFFSADKNISRLFHVKKNFFSTLYFFLKNPADILFNPKDNISFTYVLLSRIIRAKHSVGLSFPFHDEHYNAVLNIQPSEHIIRKNFALLDYLKIHYTEADLVPYIPPAEIGKEIREFAEKIKGKKYIALNISAGSPVREQRKECWQQIISLLPYPVIVFAMPDRYADKEWLEKQQNVLKSPHIHTFSESEYILKQCTLLISPDTAMIHVASAAQIATVGLFLTEYDAERFAPFQVPHIILYGKESLEDIKPVSILDAAVGLLRNALETY